MRKIAMILSMGLILLLNVNAAAQQKDELFDLAALMTNHQLDVSDWQVTIKEEMNADKAIHLLDKLRAKYGYKVTGTEKENAVNYDIEYTTNSGITEHYQVVIPNNTHYNATFAVNFAADTWDNKMADAYIQRKEAVQSAYFSHKSTTFACLTTTIDDKIKDVYVINELKQSLQLETVKTQHDNVKDSPLQTLVYGYTPLWDQAITMEEPINLQMAIHESTYEDEGKRLTVGTPILIHEY